MKVREKVGWAKTGAITHGAPLNTPSAQLAEEDVDLDFGVLEMNPCL
jgi:hypothetical protein